MLEYNVTCSGAWPFSPMDYPALTFTLRSIPAPSLCRGVASYTARRRPASMGAFEDSRRAELFAFPLVFVILLRHLPQPNKFRSILPDGMETKNRLLRRTSPYASGRCAHRPSSHSIAHLLGAQGPTSVGRAGALPLEDGARRAPFGRMLPPTAQHRPTMIDDPPPALCTGRPEHVCGSGASLGTAAPNPMLREMRGQRLRGWTVASRTSGPVIAVRPEPRPSLRSYKVPGPSCPSQQHQPLASRHAFRSRLRLRPCRCVRPAAARPDVRGGA